MKEQLSVASCQFKNQFSSGKNHIRLRNLAFETDNRLPTTSFQCFSSHMAHDATITPPTNKTKQ